MSRRLKEDAMTHCGTHYDYLVVMMRSLINYYNALKFKELEGQRDGRWGEKYCRREMEIVEELEAMVGALQVAKHPEFFRQTPKKKKKGGKR